MRAIFFEPDEAWRLLAVAEASDAELCAFPTLVLYRGFDCPKPPGLNAAPSRCRRRARSSAKRKTATSDRVVPRRWNVCFREASQCCRATGMEQSGRARFV
jgi:hypothetical protein